MDEPKERRVLEGGHGRVSCPVVGKRRRKTDTSHNRGGERRRVERRKGERARLLTVREVARLLRVKPDTLYRWARVGKLPATKLGKEWRVHPDDVERLLGRSMPSERGPNAPAGHSPLPSPNGGAGALSVAALERELRTFVEPRDHLLAVTETAGALAQVSSAFWALALAAGGPLVIPHPPGARDEVMAALRAKRNRGLQLVEAADGTEARAAVAAARARGRTVWASFTALGGALGGGEGLLEHEHQLGSACVARDMIVLCGNVAGDPELPFSDAWRLEAAHRGVVRASLEGTLLYRYR